jgi:predicted nucleotidyltransferase component of viral defense system
LELSIHDLLNPPVVVADIGPVLAVEDVLASKILAMVDRAAARDFIDVAEAMRKGWDRRLEEHIEGSGLDPARIRALLKAWPRTAPYSPDQG